MGKIKMVLHWLIVNASVLVGPKRVLTEAEVRLLEDIHYPWNPWSMRVVPLDEMGVRQMSVGLRMMIVNEVKAMEDNSGSPLDHLEYMEKLMEPALFWARQLKYNPGLRGAGFMKDIHEPTDEDYQKVKESLAEGKANMVAMAAEQTRSANS